MFAKGQSLYKHSINLTNSAGLLPLTLVTTPFNFGQHHRYLFSLVSGKNASSNVVYNERAVIQSWLVMVVIAALHGNSFAQIGLTYEPSDLLYVERISLTTVEPFLNELSALQNDLIDTSRYSTCGNHRGLSFHDQKTYNQYLKQYFQCAVSPCGLH
jgi:hypothetical protein